jgi:hypothetical protein
MWALVVLSAALPSNPFLGSELRGSCADVVDWYYDVANDERDSCCEREEVAAPRVLPLARDEYGVVVLEQRTRPIDWTGTHVLSERWDDANEVVIVKVPTEHLGDAVFNGARMALRYTHESGYLHTNVSVPCGRLMDEFFDHDGDGTRSCCASEEDDVRTIAPAATVDYGLLVYDDHMPPTTAWPLPPTWEHWDPATRTGVVQVHAHEIDAFLSALNPLHHLDYLFKNGRFTLTLMFVGEGVDAAALLPGQWAFSSFRH